MSTAPTRRERERARHRQEILDATLRVVARRGVDGLTIEHVAREAEFAVGSIYRYFPSKDELIQELLGDLADRFLTELEAIVGGPEPFAERFEHVVQLGYDRQVAISPLIQAFTATPGPMPGPDSPGGALMLSLRTRYFGAFDALIQSGQAEGALRPGPSRPMALALVGLLQAFARAEALHGAPMAEDAADLVRELFLNGCAARPGEGGVASQSGGV